jgi:hypothetical protein
LNFDFKGFGAVSAGSASDLTDSQASWESDEWAGDAVFIVSGGGAGQFGTIAYNTANTLHLSEPLAFAPGAGAKYLINNGKTVNITTTWEYLGKQYSATIECLIINHRNSSEFGF